MISAPNPKDPTTKQATDDVIAKAAGRNPELQGPSGDSTLPHFIDGKTEAQRAGDRGQRHTHSWGFPRVETRSREGLSGLLSDPVS